MKKILENMFLLKKPILIYTNLNETGKFNYGTIIAINDFEFAFKMIAPNGEFDGYTTIKISDVYKVETEGQYFKKMERICLDKIYPDFSIDVDIENILFSLLEWAIKQNEIVSIELVNSGYNDIVGLGEFVDDDILKFIQFDEYGEYDGVGYVKIDDITKVSFLCEEEQLMKRLIRRQSGTVSVKT